MAQQCDKQDDQSEGISIQNIGGVFIIIFVGIGLASITLAFEYWWYKYRKTSKVITMQESTSQITAPKSKSKQDISQKNVPTKLYPRARF